MSTRGRIVVAGASGFLGAPLTAALVRGGFDVVTLTRAGRNTPRAAETIKWDPNGSTGPWAAALDGADAVVNLAGENIGGRRWTAAHKARVADSRINATRSIAAAILAARHPPKTLVSASGINYYGPHGDETLTEEDRAGDDFMARLCASWEGEAMRARGAGTRVVVTRTGLAIEAGGGALAPMLLPFRLGIGGRLGSGRQYWSWIHRADWVRLVEWVLETDAVSGPVNATAPRPVTNAEFTRALGTALHRPAIFPAPAFALRLMLGEMADALVLAGQRVLPAKAQRLGFRFQYERLEDAFRAVFGERSAGNKR